MMSTTQPKQTWHLVVADMLQRNEDGAAKYNRYLQTDCPDDMLSHLYNELLDAVVYIRTEISKRENKSLSEVIRELTEEWLKKEEEKLLFDAFSSAGKEDVEFALIAQKEVID